METLYEHAGGHDGVHRFIEAFYASVLADPQLVPLFGTGRPEHVGELTAVLAETFGGPDTFSTDMGGCWHLIEVHRGLGITEEQRRRFAELFLAAADTARLPDDAPFREALRGYVELLSTVAMQNSHARTNDELHPLAEIPRWQWPHPPG
jgi:hemoglobin